MKISLDGGDTWIEAEKVIVQVNPWEGQDQPTEVTVTKDGLQAEAYLTDGSHYSTGTADWEVLFADIDF